MLLIIMSSLAWVDPHSADLLGREIAPAVVIPPPPLRFYPGPAAAWPAAILFGALFGWGFLSGRYELSPGFYQFIGGCAALMLILAVASTIRRTQLRLTMSMRELGVVLTTGARKQHNLRYSDLEELTVADSARYDNDRNLVAFNRTLTFGSAGKRVRAHYVAVPDDALDPLLDDLARRMAERRPCRGSGWAVEGNMLVAGGTHIPLAAISAAGVFDNEVRIWQHGHAEHSFAVPLSSRNARVLHRIAVNARTAVPPALVAIPSDTSGIGNLLFTRRTSLFSVVFRTAAIALFLWTALLVTARKAPEYPPLARPAAIACGALAVIDAIRRATRTYRFHERAVIANGRTLLFEEVVSMRWAERTTHVKAFYAGTSMKVTLTPREGGRLMIRLYRFHARDPDLAPIRRAIARHIAEGLRRQLEREGRAPWTPNAAFTAQGIEVKKKLLPYESTQGMLSDGYFVLFRESWRKPIAILNASDENFYPGLMVFEAMTRARTSA